MNRKEEGMGSGDVEGIYLSELSAGDVLVIQTQNNAYSLVYLGAGAALLVKHSSRIAEPTMSYEALLNDLKAHGKL